MCFYSMADTGHCYCAPRKDLVQLLRKEGHSHCECPPVGIWEGGLGVRQTEPEATHPSLILPTLAAGWDSPIPWTLFVWGTLVIIGKLDGYFVKHLIGETWWK